MVDKIVNHNKNTHLLNHQLLTMEMKETNGKVMSCNSQNMEYGGLNS